MIAWLLLAAVAAQRLVELPLAARNTRRLLARGAVEVGAGHYPLFVLLHAGWLLAIAWFMDPRQPLALWPLLAYGGLTALRIWTLASLGPWWTTRIVTLPGAPLVRRGPYRWIRHPNYLVVLGEIAVLPLAFHLPWVSLAFALPNLALICYRVGVENAALAGRRALPSQPPGK